jgi:5-dehydro-4-deoxyglucarate dehydratase
MKFQGVLFFPVTPFAADGSLDEIERATRVAVETTATW